MAIRPDIPGGIRPPLDGLRSPAEPTSTSGIRESVPEGTVGFAPFRLAQSEGPIAAPAVAGALSQTPGMSLALQREVSANLLDFMTLEADGGNREPTAEMRAAAGQIVARMAQLPWRDSLDFDSGSDESILAALPRIHQVLKEGFNVNSGAAPLDLPGVAAQHRANCFGSTQMLLSIARAAG